MLNYKLKQISFRSITFPILLLDFFKRLFQQIKIFCFIGGEIVHLMQISSASACLQMQSFS